MFLHYHWHAGGCLGFALHCWWWLVIRSVTLWSQWHWITPQWACHIIHTNVGWSEVCKNKSTWMIVQCPADLSRWGESLFCFTIWLGYASEFLFIDCLLIAGQPKVSVMPEHITIVWRNFFLNSLVNSSVAIMPVLILKAWLMYSEMICLLYIMTNASMMSTLSSTLAAERRFHCLIVSVLFFFFNTV